MKTRGAIIISTVIREAIIQVSSIYGLEEVQTLEMI
jgi:hypothetical protein